MSLQDTINNLNAFEEKRRNYNDFACSIMPISLGSIEPKTSIAKNKANNSDLYSLERLIGLSERDEKIRAVIQEAISMIKNDKWIEGTLPVFDKTKLIDNSSYYDTAYGFNSSFFVKVKGPNDAYNQQMRERVYLLSWSSINSSIFPKKHFNSRRKEAIQELENCVNFYYNNIRSCLYGSQKYVIYQGDILFEDGYSSLPSSPHLESALAKLVRANQ